MCVVSIVKTRALELSSVLSLPPLSCVKKACLCAWEAALHEDERGQRWCFAWPQRVLQGLGNELSLFVSNMRRGVTLITRFSGMECPGHAAREIELACQQKGVMQLEPGQGFRLHSACDNDRRALFCLASFEKDSGFQKYAPQHIFKNMEDMVTQECLEKMQAIMNEKVIDPSRSAEDTWNFTKKIMDALVLEKGLKTRSQYILHKDGPCSLRPEDVSSSSGPVLEVAGAACVDYSRKGKRMKENGRSCLPFCVWLAQVIMGGVNLLLHECTEDFPDEMLQRPLAYYGSRSWRMAVFRLCPSHFGWPRKRPRRYSVLWNSGKVNFTGSQQDFIQKFFEETALKGSVFFCEGDDLPPDASKSRWEALQQYRDQWHQRTQMSNDIADLNQRPPFGKLDSSVPCLLTHNSMYCLGKRRLLTACETLSVQGISSESVVWKAARNGDLSETGAKHLAGNGMHAVCIGSLLAYVVANTRAAQADSERFTRKPASSRLFDA